MDGIIEAFHLDIKLLIAQLINFTIVLAVLYKFAYKPLLKTMNERSKKIERGLKDAQASQDQLAKAEKIRDEKIKETKKEAKQLLEKMQIVAEKNKDFIIEKAQKKTENMMQETKKNIEIEKKKMIMEVRQEIGKLTGMALEKILDEKQFKKIDKSMMNKAVSEIKKS